MPNLNGTGPAGQGPMTGRRMGRCKAPVSDQQQAGANNDYIPYGRGGRGPGMGRCGGGRGRGAGRGQGQQNRFRGAQ